MDLEGDKLNFKDISIKRKISYLFLPLAIIPIIIFAFLSTRLYEDSIVERSLDSMEDNNTLVANRMDDVLSEAESGATFLTISINSLLNNEYQGELTDDIKQYNLISNELTYAKLIYEEIDSIAFYDRDDRLYYTNNALARSEYFIKNSEMLKTLEASTGSSIWFDFEKRLYLTSNPKQSVITLGKKVWNINTGETIGYLFINITEDTFIDIINDQVSDYFIYDIDHQLLSTYYGGEKSILEANEHDTFLDSLASSDLISHGSFKILVSKVGIDRVDWILLSQTNLESLTQDLSKLLIIVTIMVVVIILFDIVLTNVLNGLITNPIMNLKLGIEEISKGNFDYRFKLKTNDEIGLFADSFNHMSDEIKNLINRVEEEEKNKRTFELALIQQQIKPHFLYNSLDIILKLSQLGQSRKAQKVTMRLADYYKHSLSGGADIVTVKDELQITKDYLELQKMRYSDILDYEINMTHVNENRYIPKLTLQPLVENAIYHGLKNKSESGTVKIYDEETSHAYYIVVSDNGLGMLEDVYKKLVSNLEDRVFDHNLKMNEGFGMSNVHHRLKLFLGETYGLEIETLYGNGTKIKVKLPKEGKDD